MSPPLRVPLSPVAAGTTWIDGDTGHYIARVHRLGPGDRLVVFDPETAREADAEVVAVDRASVQIAIAEPREAERTARRSVTLIQATGKGDKVDAVVRDATELGATRIVPVIAERSIARPAAESARVTRWRRIAVEAARQSGRGDVPTVDAPLLLTAALALLSPHATAAAGFCMHPRATASFGPRLVALEATRAIVILVGPEGGLSDRELEAAAEAGFDAVTIGRLVLRTETVCAAALGAVAALACEA